METMDEPYRPVVTTQAELEAVWRHLMEPLAPDGGFAGHSLWMLRLGPDRRPHPQLVEISGCEGSPDEQMRDGLADVIRLLDSDDPGGSFAFLRSRPGRGGIDADDRRWASFVHGAGRSADVRLEVVHVATDDGVTAVPLDEIGLLRPA
jgi:hypothetical protein